MPLIKRKVIQCENIRCYIMLFVNCRAEVRRNIFLVFFFLDRATSPAMRKFITKLCVTSVGLSHLSLSAINGDITLDILIR